ncbi:YchJ family protein [Deinococcus aestuarii]|uniref:YchJ family protein n=1 Tax=Deinococcus aestuarii TaxID=2774531 RepID=UPI001C0D57CE|nr:YchJ family metal-binding protein [Deinococcus aestuarii]
MPLPFPVFKPCPCGSGRSYGACCGPLHRGEREAATPEELMRSRYSAYALRDTAYVRRTWHPGTCPPDLDLDDDEARYLGLTVQRAEGDEVTFTATLRVGGRTHRLRERSTFARLEGRWVYVDGVTA